jgi:hypothetical protein
MRFNNFYKSQNINTIEQNSNTIKAKNSIANIKFFTIFLTMSRVRFLTIKSRRTINWTRFDNQKTCLIFIRERKQKRSCQDCAASSRIFANCVAMTIFFKNFCTLCYYNFENDRCNFRFKFEVDSSSNRKRVRESKTKFVLSIIKRQTRRRNFFFFFSFFSKARKSRSTMNQKLEYDRDLFTNLKRLRKISSLFTKLRKLFNFHAWATEKKLKRKQNDE